MSLFKCFDTKCYELAAYFVANEPKNQERTAELAGVIQQAIEDYLEIGKQPPPENPLWIK